MTIGPPQGATAGRAATGDPIIALHPHHTNYGQGARDEEFFRVTNPPRRRLEVLELGIALRGTNQTFTNLNVDVYDLEAGRVLAETSDRVTAGDDPLAKSEPGNTVIGRITNLTGQPREVSVFGQLKPEYI